MTSTGRCTTLGSGKGLCREQAVRGHAGLRAGTGRWPHVLSNAVDPGWARTKMGGPGAPVDLDTGQRTQTWLAASDDPAALVTGRYWHQLQQEQPAIEAADPEFQDQLIAKLAEPTGVALPDA